MTGPHCPSEKYVVGPYGTPLTIADLPPPSTKRWVIRRKAKLVAAVRGGLLSLEEVCARYTLTVEEFRSWEYSIDQHGLGGLRTTRIQEYRCSLIRDRGVSFAQGSTELGVNVSQLRDRVKKCADDPQHAFSGNGQTKPEQLEIAQLKREVIKLKAECEFARKAAAYFAKEST
jgi:transposase-like protein